MIGEKDASVKSVRIELVENLLLAMTQTPEPHPYGAFYIHQRLTSPIGLWESATPMTSIDEAVSRNIKGSYLRVTSAKALKPTFEAHLFPEKVESPTLVGKPCDCGSHPIWTSHRGNVVTWRSMGK